ncbi:glycoside hydrolase [Aspergillus coremiiformis]|uniref:Glycoside hydrolase n=1 Tax=Aspergillus coremiiformis TaxID=138285 RepID=A0A5N6ZGY0_9EURO|nr:glycoside hydrolase [Aspergillus coremiiformis]
MTLLRIFILLLSWCGGQAQAKAVFAHFMVGNSAKYSNHDWKHDIQLALKAHIDAFALNMAHNTILNESLEKAFDIAEDLDFKLFFSFDYAANGSWPKQDTIDLMNQYKDHPAYYKHHSKPFLSTFEGATSHDWPEIKNRTDTFFIPDWSSIGPEAAANNSYVDGLFSWDAWPAGPTEMNTSADEAYRYALQGRPYMMPVSPWFYTNLPGFDKNWVWRGDNLWHDRWQQVISFQPEFVEIISWNDYGESHYIGPLRQKAFEAFEQGDAPFNYADNMPHDGWRTFLPFVIDQYKNPNSTIHIPKENVVSWYRLHPVSVCTTNGTTGNSKTQGQIEYQPSQLLEDRIMYSALLRTPANVTVTIGKDTVPGSWDGVPTDGRGIYHGSVPFTSKLGKVKVAITRGKKEVASITGNPITSTCPRKEKGVQNYNAWVGTSGADCTMFMSKGLGIFSFGVIIFTLLQELDLF